MHIASFVPEVVTLNTFCQDEGNQCYLYLEDYDDSYDDDKLSLTMMMTMMMMTMIMMMTMTIIMMRYETRR